jgi:anhydro-N-acetylmuramic acid kinase
MHPDLYLGIMSGTSLDGVDVALAIHNQDGFFLADHHFIAYSPPLKQTLLDLHTPCNNELEAAQLTAITLSHLYAEAVNALLIKCNLKAAEITAIGCHGQTIRHRPELGFTLQLANLALLAELTSITVVGDFRSRDIAAGGQGAPLVPAFHQAVFGSATKNRAIVNIGGIANISYLPVNGQVLGFDSGPGNMLIDSWTFLKTGKSYDANGAWADTGVVLDSFLSNMLTEPYFAEPPPKSTGRDLFNDEWLTRHILYPHCKPEDIAKTLTALTAQSTPVLTTNALGVDVDWVEAVAFAWLAKQTISHQTSNLPTVTGASGTRILGAIYPK